MHVEKMLLETDPQGQMKTMPTLPPNSRVEAIILGTGRAAADFAIPADKAPSRARHRWAGEKARRSNHAHRAVGGLGLPQMIVLDTHVWF